jgi:hypothetical protein
MILFSIVIMQMFDLVVSTAASPTRRLLGFGGGVAPGGTGVVGSRVVSRVRHIDGYRRGMRRYWFLEVI